MGTRVSLDIVKEIAARWVVTCERQGRQGRKRSDLLRTELGLLWLPVLSVGEMFCR